jgi:hypothetical protein
MNMTWKSSDTRARAPRSWPSRAAAASAASCAAACKTQAAESGTHERHVARAPRLHRTLRLAAGCGATCRSQADDLVAHQLKAT